MEFRMVVSGVGGQGILFATRLLEDAALAAGEPVIGAETHGMSQRGGSVVSHFKVGPFGSPMVRTGSADCLLGLNLTEAWRSAHFVRDGGLAVINTVPDGLDGSKIAARLRERGIDIWTHDADAVAMGLGAPGLANVALLGCASAHAGFPFEVDQIRAAVERISPVRYQELNLSALGSGHAHGLTLAAEE